MDNEDLIPVDSWCQVYWHPEEKKYYAIIELKHKSIKILLEEVKSNE